MKWKLEQRNINDLLPNRKNPRKLSKKEAGDLKESVQKFGLCEPIVINSDNSVIGGHQRLKILAELGNTEVEVYVPERSLNKEETEELNLRLNKNKGDWDYDILANEWDLDIVLESGFTMEDLHLESLPGQDEPEEGPQSQSCTMNITFMDAGHLQEAENQIATIVDAYPGSHYKVRIK